jgi:DNA-binding NarL/FixJ family response regulator
MTTMDKSNNSKRTILIVDDHPINVDVYQTLLANIESNKKAEYLIAFNCKQAYNTMNNYRLEEKTIDFAFIDISLPAYEEKKILSGSDIALLIRKIFPNCKIVVISMHNEPLWVNQIYKGINPEGFIAKSDLSYKCFPEIFQSIEKNEVYFSKSIKVSQKIMIQKNINWDDFDSKILQFIAQGIKTINLPDFIPLSLSTIEKRKANIKKQLILDNGSDKDLIDVARNLGFI